MINLSAFVILSTRFFILIALLVLSEVSTKTVNGSRCFKKILVYPKSSQLSYHVRQFKGIYVAQTLSVNISISSDI